MKKTSGRRKIEIKRIEKTDSRQVTFTKRRKGLFNKAAELCVLTNAEVVILAQSVGGGRVYAFAHPDVDFVIDTYLGNNVSKQPPLSEDLRCMYEEYNKKYLEIVKEIEVEKKKSGNVVESSGGFWWENSFEGLEMDELETVIDSMEKLKIKVTEKADELRNSATSSSLDEIANEANSSSFDEIANANIVGGLLDDQVILPNLDQFLPYNVGFANEDLMMPPVNYDSSGFNNYSFGNGELVLDNHDDEHYDGGDNLQVQSDFGTFGVPDDLHFGQD